MSRLAHRLGDVGSIVVERDIARRTGLLATFMRRYAIECWDIVARTPA